MKKKKLRNTRPKALFGEVAAAGITAAATLAAAGIGAAATAKAAKEQSDATIANAKQQAASIEATNTNNNQLQQQSQQFIAQENEANRQIQRDLQMNLQLQSGQLDMEQRRAASRIQVKKGGKVSRKKLRDAFFYGGGNLPFRVTDGGGVLPLGQTPEGYDLYEIIGNDHDHYHKTRSGKYKSGVGIEFDIPNNGSRLVQAKGGKATKVVEGEGNQNTEQGELLLMTPDSGMFISKHKNNGFNPAEAVMEGMHPLTAYNIQESLKGSSPVRRNGYKALAGVSTNYILPTDYPISDLGFDMSGINVGAARRQLKKGGRCKAPYGAFIGPQPYGYYTAGAYTPFDKWAGMNLNPQLTNSFGVNTTNKWGKYKSQLNSSSNSGRSRWSGLSGNLWGAGITTLGNIGGALLTNWGASRASRALNNAYLESGKMLADAYSNLKTVDMSTLSRDTFRNQHYLPVVRSSNYNVNPELSDVNRQARGTLRAVNNNTLSSAARLSRMGGVNTAADMTRSKIYAEKGNREEAIKQENAKMINEAAARNAELDIQSRRDYVGHYIDLLKYNNDIANERITGRAQALSDAIMGGVGARAAYMQSAGQSWGNAIAGSGQAFGNAFATDAAQQANIRMALAGASSTGQYNYYMSGDNYDRSGAYGVYSDYVAMSKSAKDSRDKDEWTFRANQLARKYGFATV